MEHIRKEAHAIAEPEDTPPTTKEDILLEKTINKEIAEMQQTADEADDWKPDIEHVATMVKYLRRTYTKRTAQGPDDITPDLILFADGIIVDCLLAILQLMSEAASSPDSWRRMLIVLVQKEGRDPQNLRTGYRPICVGSILMKAAEQAALNWTRSKLELKPHHTAIMAYKKGTGHDMAVFTVTATILHVKFEAKKKGDKEPRLWIIGTDVENAFNGTWRELVEWTEWKKHQMQGTMWSLIKNLTGNMTYTVKVHGQETRTFTQRKGWDKDRYAPQTSTTPPWNHC
jgi:hypothetical protein